MIIIDSHINDSGAAARQHGRVFARLQGHRAALLPALAARHLRRHHWVHHVWSHAHCLHCKCGVGPPDPRQGLLRHHTTIMLYYYQWKLRRSPMLPRICCYYYYYDHYYCPIKSWIMIISDGLDHLCVFIICCCQKLLSNGNGSFGVLANGLLALEGPTWQRHRTCVFMPRIHAFIALLFSWLSWSFVS